MKAVWVVLATVAVAVLGALTFEPRADPIDHQAAAYYRPRSANYTDIPLPVAAPPAGAVVRAPGVSDPAVSGQQISFEYPGFTVTACSRDVRTADGYACAAQPGTARLRVIRSGARVTTYAVSTKASSGLRGPLAARVLRRFATGTVAPDPVWMTMYVEAQVHALFD
ncbi:MAG: hypothetical protein ACJ72L_14665 [Marmoricola sp.]